MMHIWQSGISLVHSRITLGLSTSSGFCMDDNIIKLSENLVIKQNINNIVIPTLV